MLLLCLTALAVTAQIADLGSARSAASEGYHWAEQPEPGGGGHGRGSVRCNFPRVERLSCARKGADEVYPITGPQSARCRQQRFTQRTSPNYHSPYTITLNPSTASAGARAVSGGARPRAHAPPGRG